MFDQNALDSAWGNSSTIQQPQQTMQPKKSGGLSSFLGGVAHAAVSPFEYLGRAAIVNPTRELAAQFSGNKVAATNAEKASNKNLGLGEKGTDFTGGLKTFVGNSAQALLTPLAPGATGIKAAAKLGAATGAASALTDRNSTAGDVLAGGLIGGATGGALGAAGKVIGKVAGKQASGESGGFMKNLTTQGQQAQGRVAGVSAGSKIGGRELTPQDTAQMLDTLKTEGIKTGNANNTLRDVTDKLKGYGQQIADHFKVNDHPLKPEDTKVIASNFVDSLKTTDPSVLKQADILANDLQKNVSSTKDLWEFRKTLDSRIPDSKFMDEATTAKVAALKAMREYVSNELGTVPAMGNYHTLSEIKPFVSAESKRLNNPGGGIVGRILSSGPVQKLESSVGKATEAVGSSNLSSIPTVPKAVSTGTAPTRNFTGGLFRQGTAAEAGGAMVPNQETGSAPQELPQATTGLLDDGSDTPNSSQPQDTSPFSPANVQDNIKAILAQGGTMKDVSEYLANAKAFNDLTGAVGGAKKPISATAADAIANAQAGLTSLDQIEQELTKNPSVQGKEAITQTFNPFGATGRVTGTSSYDTAITQAKDVIARLRTGAAISSSEETRFTRMLPQPADPSDTVKQKLSLLRNALNTVVQRVGGNSSDLLQEAAQAAQ